MKRCKIQVNTKSNQVYDVGGLGEAVNGGQVDGFDHVVMKQVTKQVNLKNVGLYVLH